MKVHEIAELVGGICLLVLTLFVGTLLAPSLKGMEWAAWVQAIGSVAAILATLCVVANQNEHNAKLARDAEKNNLVRQAQTVAVLVDKLIAEFEWIRIRFSSADTAAEELFNWHDSEFFSEILPAIDAVPLYSLGHPDLVRGMYELKKGAVNIRKIMKGANVAVEAGDVDFTNWDGNSIVSNFSTVNFQVKLAHDIFRRGLTSLATS